MTALELAAVVVVIAAVAAVAVAVVTAVVLLRAVRELQAAATVLAETAHRAATEVGALTEDARRELTRADELLERADSISSTIEGATRLTYLAVSNPVIKAAAVASGVRRGARRLRDQPNDDAVTAIGEEG